MAAAKRKRPQVTVQTAPECLDCVSCRCVIGTGSRFSVKQTKGTVQANVECLLCVLGRFADVHDLSPVVVLCEIGRRCDDDKCGECGSN